MFVQKRLPEGAAEPVGLSYPTVGKSTLGEVSRLRGNAVYSQTAMPLTPGVEMCKNKLISVRGDRPL